MAKATQFGIAHDRTNTHHATRQDGLLFGFPKQEPPLDGSFIFPLEDDSVVRPRLPKKETDKTVSPHDRPAYAVF